MFSKLLYPLLVLVTADFAVSSAQGEATSVDSNKAPIFYKPVHTVRLADDSISPRAAALDFSASQWIWTNEVSVPGGTAPVGTRAFRKDFTAPLGKTPVQADIIITVDNGLTMFVNGAEVGTGGNFTVAERFCFPLQPCLNVFAVTATNAGGPAGILATILITYTDGTTSTIVSDTTWRYFLTVPDGYEQLSYDDNSWTPAVAEGPYGVAPWGQISIPSSAPALALSDVSWIWTSEVVNGAAPAGARAFRKTYTPPTGHTATLAKIIITADNEYTLYVNGVLVGSGSTWPVAQTYTVDLSPASNVVFAVYAVNAAGPAGLLAAIEITLSECSCSSGVIVYTDAGWKSYIGTPYGFQLAGYDDSSWPTATVEGPEGMPPWGSITVSSSSGPVTAVSGAPAGQKNETAV
ncbi:lectin [Mycena belliarum]|uniref:Lectin n=1 Tax=Mycena belliarum TaxID=1033014 RepID=A0AAD6ULF1_9AGAR|nr:lectin [Mycena belliae]